MEGNIEKFDKDIYKKPKELPIIDMPEIGINNDLNLELGKLAKPEVVNFVEKDKLISDSLQKLFEYDHKTFKHSIEVGNIAEYLIKNLEGRISPDEAKDLFTAALVHDVGKVKIEKDLINKKEPLLFEEKEGIKKHVRHSFEMIYPQNQPVAEIIVGHHEHQKDAYPRKAQMPVDYDLRTAENRTIVLTRILAMVDAYEAMVADRPGNPPKDIKYVSSELEKQFRLPGDQEIIFLLLEYYYAKNKNQTVGVKTWH